MEGRKECQRARRFHPEVDENYAGKTLTAKGTKVH